MGWSTLMRGEPDFSTYIKNAEQDVSTRSVRTKCRSNLNEPGRLTFVPLLLKLKYLIH